jgi:thiol-disulfide isomerase/thioredoxin
MSKSQLGTLVALLLAATPLPTPAAETEMKVIRLADWPGVVAAARPDVLVVDIWASWCISCIERFPEMVTMAERFSGKGVSFLTLNLDDPKDEEGIAWSNDFLARIGAEFPNYHLQENLTQSFEALDLLAIPVVLIYDGEGVERYRLTNDNPNEQFDKADVEAAVQALLAERT